MAVRMNWDNVYFKGKVIGCIKVFSEYIRPGEYKAAWHTNRGNVTPKEAFESANVEDVSQLSHEAVFLAIYHRESIKMIAEKECGHVA